MNDKSQATTALKAVQEETGRLLRRAERHIADYTAKMNDNFVRFFEWNAEEMYKEQLKRHFFEGLNSMLAGWDGEDLAADLLKAAKSKADGIVRGSLTRNSTNQMANHAHLLTLQAAQEIIHELENLAFVANHYAEQ